MQTPTSFSKANQAIDIVINKGAKHLYNTYLRQKVPKHANQQINNTLKDFFNTGFQGSPQKPLLNNINTPQQINKDHLSTGKILIRKSLFVGGPVKQRKKRNKRNFSEIYKNVEQNSCNESELLVKMNEEKKQVNPQEMKLRISKKKQQKREEQQQLQKMRNQQKIQLKKRILKKKIQQLDAKGIPYYFDDDGNLIIPQKNQIKKNLQTKNKNDKTIHLNYQTIDFNSKLIMQPKYRSLTGRKKGFTHSIYSKKLKLTDRQYNNNHQRQYSAIPFLNLKGGIKILQKGKNITASKLKQSEHTRQSFINENKKTFFKSFIPDTGDQISALSMQTISFDVNRPFTTDNFERTKRTVQTAGQGNSTKRSILWRPCTTQKQKRQNRLKVNNQELAKQITIQ